jgi:hypothetical protein
MRRLLVLALLGCASGGSGAPPAVSTPDRILMVDERGRVLRTTDNPNEGSEQLVPAAPGATLQALVGAYGELGLAVNTLETREGRVAARGVAAPRRIAGKPLSAYLDCGNDVVGAPAANGYAVLLNVESLVTPDAPGTVRIRSFVTASARAQGVSSTAVHCTTTGALEKRLHLAAATKLTT